MKQHHLRIKRHYSIVPHTINQVELRSGVWQPTSFVIHDHANTGKLFPILKDLDGELSTYEVAQKHSVTRGDVEGILNNLQQLKVLESGASTAIDYYIEGMHSHPTHISESQRILIIGDTKAVAAVKYHCSSIYNADLIETLDLENPLIKRLKSTDQWLLDGLAMQEMVESFVWWKNHFIVLALSHNDPVLAMHLNQVNYMLGTHWIHGVMDGPFIFIGPGFISHAGPCYHCFEKRVAMNLREYASYQRYKEMLITESIHPSAKYDIKPVFLNLFASYLALEIQNYQLTKTCFTKAKVFSVYLPTMETGFHEVLKLSNCQVCGIVTHQDDQQLYFDYQTLLEEAS